VFWFCWAELWITREGRQIECQWNQHCYSIEPDD
jgi:hypothetical protein